MNRKSLAAAAASVALAAGMAVTAAAPASAASARAMDVLNAAAVPAAANAWYVDARSGDLVVEVASHTAGTKRFVDRAKAAGADVRTVVTEPYRAYYDVVGGDAWYTDSWRCSVGFSATGSGGSKHFVTAGHCTERPADDAYGYNRVWMGKVGGSTFGRQGDYGKVDVTSSAWTLTSKIAGTGTRISGSQEAPIGASVCRSGSTTGVHCGVIEQKNVTVRYQGAGVIGGLTRTSVCAEPGDSGGPYFSGNQAQGMTSGGSGNCTFGGTTFFQPVNEALNRYRLTLVTG